MSQGVRVRELAPGISRVTFPLPLGIDHVNCYLLRGGDGWTLVDTGLGLPGAEERWTAVLAQLDAPVSRIVITHGHPDHVGDTVPAAELTAAPVLQGRLDHRRCLEVWADPEWPARASEHLRAHGMPEAAARASQEGAERVARMIHFARDVQLLEPGDRVEGWEVVHLPGHADGHIVLLRDGVLIAGDVLLDRITPVVGLYPGGRPDPLDDYLASLAALVELAPGIAYAGHGPTIRAPAERAREIAEHHRVRAEQALHALADGPRNAYEVSLELFGPLTPDQQRFAVAETLAHLEHLVRAGRATRGANEFSAAG